MCPCRRRRPRGESRSRSRRSAAAAASAPAPCRRASTPAAPRPCRPGTARRAAARTPARRPRGRTRCPPSPPRAPAPAGSPARSRSPPACPGPTASARTRAAPGRPSGSGSGCPRPGRPTPCRSAPGRRARRDRGGLAARTRTLAASPCGRSGRPPPPSPSAADASGMLGMRSISSRQRRVDVRQLLLLGGLLLLQLRLAGDRGRGVPALLLGLADLLGGGVRSARACSTVTAAAPLAVQLEEGVDLVGGPAPGQRGAHPIGVARKSLASIIRPPSLLRGPLPAREEARPRRPRRARGRRSRPARRASGRRRPAATPPWPASKQLASFASSPKATTSAASMPSRSHTQCRPLPLLTSGSATSRNSGSDLAMNRRPSNGPAAARPGRPSAAGRRPPRSWWSARDPVHQVAHRRAAQPGVAGVRQRLLVHLLDVQLVVDVQVDVLIAQLVRRTSFASATGTGRWSSQPPSATSAISAP